MSENRTLIIEDEMLIPLLESEKNKEFIAVESRSYFQDVWLRFKRNKLAIAGLVFILIIAALAVMGPIFSEYSYDGVDLANINQQPSLEHWFGTDFLGRDIYVRILYGARISLSVGFLVALFNMLVGTTYGGISGYFGGLTDLIMMRIVEMIYAMPTLLYVILIMMFFGGSIFTVVFAIGISSWIRMARIVRAQVLSLKEQEFILAARIIGSNKKRILFRHLLLNSMGPILVTVTLNVPAAIFMEAFLSFVGVGISIPMASWGTLANEALPAIFSRPYQLFFPLAAISLTMFALNFVGDGLSDAVDPKRK